MQNCLWTKDIIVCISQLGILDLHDRTEYLEIQQATQHSGSSNRAKAKQGVAGAGDGSYSRIANDRRTSELGMEKPCDMQRWAQ